MLQKGARRLQKGAREVTKRSRGYKKEQGAPFCNLVGYIKEHARVTKRIMCFDENLFGNFEANGHLNFTLNSLYPDNKSKRNVHLADNKGHIDLVLWRDNAEFENGDVLGLENIVLSEFNNHLSLTATLETIITKLNENMTISAAPPKPSPKSNVISRQTSILGLKEFSCTFKCIRCRMDVDAKRTAGPMLKYQTCSLFLKQSAHLGNCYMLYKWFSANTQVS